MPLKYVKKTEGLKQNKISHYVLRKSTRDTYERYKNIDYN